VLLLHLPDASPCSLKTVPLGLHHSLHCAAQLLIFKTLLLLSSHLVASQLCALVDNLLQPRHVKVCDSNLPNHTGSLQVCQVQRSINIPGSSSSSRTQSV
jgi:hypothetical protein